MLTVEGSVMALREFPEPLHSRGHSAPKTARIALAVFKDLLGLDWPLGRPLFLDGTETGPYCPARSVIEIR